MIASYILLNIIVQIQALKQLPIIEDNRIAITETAIRNTINSLFAAFKFPELKNRIKLKQMFTIHNFFVSITLQDCENLKEIARLSTVNNIDNSTQHFIAQINELLNEGDKKNDENDNEDTFYVKEYIGKYIEKLKDLKEAFVFDRNTKINSEILEYIDVKNNHFNITKNNIDLSRKDDEISGENILDGNEYWQPSARRIYRGIRTTIKRFPFMASVHSFRQFQCAGSIIARDLVITSASCLQVAWNNRYFRLNPMFLSVIVGCDYYERCGDNIAVLQIFFHPQYDPKTLKHNLAIMRLSRTINFKKSHGRVKKILFDKNPVGMPVNTGITVVGWGARDVTNMVYNVQKNKLSYKELDFIPLDDCQQHYSKEYVTHKNFCAGFYTKGGGACSANVFQKMGTTTVSKKVFTMADIITSTTFKIHPIGMATIGPIGRSKKEEERDSSLSISQEQRFKDYMSTMFSTDDIADNSATSASEAIKEIRKTFSAEQKQTTVTTKETQGVTNEYDISEVEHTA